MTDQLRWDITGLFRNLCMRVLVVRGNAQRAAGVKQSFNTVVPYDRCTWLIDTAVDTYMNSIVQAKETAVSTALVFLWGQSQILLSGNIEKCCSGRCVWMYACSQYCPRRLVMLVTECGTRTGGPGLITYFVRW